MNQINLAVQPADCAVEPFFRFAAVTAAFFFQAACAGQGNFVSGVPQRFWYVIDDNPYRVYRPRGAVIGIFETGQLPADKPAAIIDAAFGNRISGVFFLSLS